MCHPEVPRLTYVVAAIVVIVGFAIGEALAKWTKRRFGA